MIHEQGIAGRIIVIVNRVGHYVNGSSSSKFLMASTGTFKTLATIWFKDEIADPDQIIAEFFSAAA